MWKDGKDEWKVALDTSDIYEDDSSEGNLENAWPLSEFHVRQEYGTLSAEDACNFGVHVYSAGDVLSIFTGAGASDPLILSLICHPSCLKVRQKPLLFEDKVSWIPSSISLFGENLAL